MRKLFFLRRLLFLFHWLDTRPGQIKKHFHSIGHFAALDDNADLVAAARDRDFVVIKLNLRLPAVLFRVDQLRLAEQFAARGSRRLAARRGRINSLHFYILFYAAFVVFLEVARQQVIARVKCRQSPNRLLRGQRVFVDRANPFDAFEECHAWPPELSLGQARQILRDLSQLVAPIAKLGQILTALHFQDLHQIHRVLRLIKGHAALEHLAREAPLDQRLSEKLRRAARHAEPPRQATRRLRAQLQQDQVELRLFVADAETRQNLEKFLVHGWILRRNRKRQKASTKKPAEAGFGFEVVGLVSDGQAHAFGCASDDLGSGLDIVGIEIRHLVLGDLAELRLRDAADLGLVGLFGALADAELFLDQVAGGWQLVAEVKGAIVIDRDMRGHQLAHQRLGRVVELGAELLQLHAVLAQDGADWRRRVRLPCLDPHFYICLYLLGHLVEFKPEDFIGGMPSWQAPRTQVLDKRG